MERGESAQGQERNIGGCYSWVFSLRRYIARSLFVFEFWIDVLTFNALDLSIAYGFLFMRFQHRPSVSDLLMGQYGFHNHIRTFNSHFFLGEGPPLSSFVSQNAVVFILIIY